MHESGSVQIDFCLTRLPSKPVELRATALHDSPLVHPSGLRHVPILCALDLSPQTRRPNLPALSPKNVADSLLRKPALETHFTQALRQELMQQPQLPCDLDGCLRSAWTSATRQSGSRSVVPKETGSAASSPILPTLKTFWESKTRMRQSLEALKLYWSPVLWHIGDSGYAALRQHCVRPALRLRQLLDSWKAATRFRVLDKEFRKRVKLNKQAKVDSLLQQASEAEARGISQLQVLTKQLRPRTSKRGIHFRDEQGRMLSPQEEIQALSAFFQELYQTVYTSTKEYVLQAPLEITEAEVTSALKHLSARKVLPPGQAPARLWKLASAHLIPVLCASYNQVLQAGTLCFPTAWHQAFLALLPKVGKPPSKPSNLRPISLLCVEAKLLARIAAERLKPYLRQALHTIPQFAYSQQRQTADCLDRAFAHCFKTRETLRMHNRTVFTTFARRKQRPLVGGMVFSPSTFPALLICCQGRASKPPCAT